MLKNPPTLAELPGYRDQIRAIAARHGAEDVRVFGSVARGRMRPGSDIDFVVRLAPGRTLLDLGGFQYEVQALLGCTVDVVTAGSLGPELEAVVEQEARPL